MRRRTALLGVVAGLATVAIAEVVKPRGGTSLLLDWEEVRRSAKARLGPATVSLVSPVSLAAAAKSYRAMARKLQKPLLDFVGGLPAGVELPEFEALDREGWLDLNVGIMRRVVDPMLEKGRLPNSLIVELGRTGLDHYMAFMLAFLGRRVLGQYDPHLLGVEPIDGAGLYLVESNVEEWGRKADLPEQDLRRWLILHEMTHAWQFAAHPWLRGHMEESMRVLLDTVTQKTSPAVRIAAFAGVLPAQWRVMRQMQGTMSLIEGYSNLVMNELGDKLLPGFAHLEEAYRRRSSNKSVLDQLIWKFTGLDLKLQQYRRGEAFARAIYDAHGMKALNVAWEGPDQMPRLGELAHPENWFKRVTS